MSYVVLCMLYVVLYAFYVVLYVFHVVLYVVLCGFIRVLCGFIYVLCGFIRCSMWFYTCFMQTCLLYLHWPQSAKLLAIAPQDIRIRIDPEPFLAIARYRCSETAKY